MLIEIYFFKGKNMYLWYFRDDFNLNVKKNWEKKMEKWVDFYLLEKRNYYIYILWNIKVYII